MINTIYIEEDIAAHPRVGSILHRYPDAVKIGCRHYGEVFNRKAQNFRLQKKQPALILARKHNRRVLETPTQYGIGAAHNYYFSHMLNCLYDCRYCFLQGMFNSAHYVLFVNYENFIDDMQATLDSHHGEPVHFFSGYDCDSLALEPLTGFTKAFLPFLEKNKNALLELRTKSTQIRSLLKREPLENCVVAFSFTSDKIAAALEHKTPSVAKRIRAIIDLQQAGWQIGLRFDPLIYTSNFRQQYSALFDNIFSKIKPELTHSATLGGFRLPKGYFRKLETLYPDEKLFSLPFNKKDNMVAYPEDLRENMFNFCKDIITRYIPPEKFFSC